MSLAGSKDKEKCTRDSQRGSLHTLRQDGQRRLKNGTQCSALKQKQAEQWEDDINQCLKPEETEETKGNDLKNNDTWIKAAKDRKRWKVLENQYAKQVARKADDR